MSDFGNRDVIGVDGDSSKLKIPSFQVRSDLEAYLSGRRRWIGSLIAMFVLRKKSENYGNCVC